MTPFVLVLAALATWQAVEVWHHGSLFAGWRANLQAWPHERGVWAWLRDLLTCPFCTSVWAGFVTAAVLATGVPEGDAWYETAGAAVLGTLKLFCYGLAISRLANLANDLTHGVCRTPGRDTVSGGDPAAPPALPNNAIEDDDVRATVPFPHGVPGGTPGQPPG